MVARQGATGPGHGPGLRCRRGGHRIRRAERFFTREALARLPRAAPRPNTPQPIFILGFPRSGTTLIEQMPDLAPGDFGRRRTALRP
ncbi:MAG: sulfotransferase [Asticcacaulis sp.]